ncbi:MAG: methionine adenosyltransferase, partial [Halodesulfurarchaeum sp.]
RVRLLSQIGSPIDQPQVADIHVVTESGYTLGDVEPAIRDLVDDRLASVDQVTDAVIAGELSTF